MVPTAPASSTFVPADLAPAIEARAYAKASVRLIPLLFVCYIVAYLDRVNIGFAKLQMSNALQMSDAVYGFGAGIFFIGYFLCEVPSNLLLERVGARRWIARIMITWGIVSGAFAFVAVIPWGPLPALAGVSAPIFGFYTLRFLLGVAEAGFFPGIILYLTYWYPAPRRGRTIALFVTGVAVANVVGAPISGALMQYLDGANGWPGWRWMFVLEAIPAIVMGLVLLRLLPDGPLHASWLTSDEQRAVHERVLADQAFAASLTNRPAAPAHAHAHRVREAFGNAKVWALALVYLSMTFALYGINFWMPTLIQELGIGKAEFLKVGMLTAIPWTVAGLATVRWSTHSDRTSERRWHTAGPLFMTATGLALLGVVGHAPVWSMLALTMIAAGVLMCMAIFWTIPTAFLRGSAAAAGIAWINSVGNLGGHFGPDLIGRIRTATNSTTVAFVALATLAAVGAIITLIATRPTPNAARSVASLDVVRS